MTKKVTAMARVLIAVGLVAAVALLAGCAQGGSEASAPDAAAAGPMTVKIVEPTGGAEVPAGTVNVKVETSGLKFTMPSNNRVAGEGHVHFTLDDQPFVMSVEPGTEFKDVAPGTHTLKAELVQNDTKPFEPAVEETIEFTVK